VSQHAVDEELRERTWRQLESEHRHFGAVLSDVEALARMGSFESSARRFGEVRLGVEQHLQLADALLGIFRRCTGYAPLASRVGKQRQSILAQTDRIWSRLSTWDGARLSPMLGRLGRLVAEHASSERLLVLGEVPLPPAPKRSQAELLRRIGRI